MKKTKNYTPIKLPNFSTTSFLWLLEDFLEPEAYSYFSRLIVSRPYALDRIFLRYQKNPNKNPVIQKSWILFKNGSKTPLGVASVFMEFGIFERISFVFLDNNLNEELEFKKEAVGFLISGLFLLTTADILYSYSNPWSLEVNLNEKKLNEATLNEKKFIEEFSKPVFILKNFYKPTEDESVFLEINRLEIAQSAWWSIDKNKEYRKNLAYLEKKEKRKKPPSKFLKRFLVRVFKFKETHTNHIK